MKEYLIPDLWNIVLQYCWPNTNDFHTLCEYGYYEKVAIIEDEISYITFDVICKYNHKSMIKLIINKVVQIHKNENILNWDEGLYGACFNGDMEIINLMIKKGANDWDVGLNGACYGGNMEIVKLMIEKGANAWNLGYAGCFFNQGTEIMNLMIEKGAND